MSREEQASYYAEADRQRQLHKQLYPEWSNGENYVGPAGAADAAGNPGSARPSVCPAGQEEAPQAEEAPVQQVDAGRRRYAPAHPLHAHPTAGALPPSRSPREPNPTPHPGGLERSTRRRRSAGAEEDALI